MVRGKRQSLTKTFNGQLCVAFDAPEIANLIKDSQGVRCLY